MAPNNSDSDERGSFIDAGNGPVALAVAASDGGREDRHNREFPLPLPPEIRDSPKGEEGYNEYQMNAPCR